MLIVRTQYLNCFFYQRETEAYNLAKLSTAGSRSTSSSSGYEHGRKQSTATINEVFVSLDKDPPPVHHTATIQEEEARDEFTVQDEVKNSTTAHKRRKILKVKKVLQFYVVFLLTLIDIVLLTY